MINYLFPFSLVEKNSRIILYASGTVGQAYYTQLTLTGYVTIVSWVDKNPNRAEVVPRTTLKNHDEASYDLVLLAVLNDYTASEIKKELLSFGIIKDKIIHVKPIIYTSSDFMGFHSSLTFSDLVNCEEKINTALDECFYYTGGDVDFFYKLMNEIIFITQGDDALKKAIHDSIVRYITKSDLSVRKAFLLLKMLYVVGCLYADGMKLYVSNARLLDIGAIQRYWLLLDIERVWFFNMNAVYNNLSNDIHKLVTKVACDFNLKWNPKCYDHSSKKICIMFYSFRELQRGVHESWISDFINRGYEIHILDIEYNLYDGNGYFPRIITEDIELQIRRNMEKLEMVKNSFPDEVLFYCTNIRDVKERQERILNIIAEINPLCVFDFCENHFVASYYMFQNYPIIKFPLKRSGFSSTFFHKVLVLGDDDFHPPITQEQVIKSFYCFEIKKSLRTFTRAEYNLNEDDIVCITVGNRLNMEITEDFFVSMFNLMNEHKKIKWLIVGVKWFSFLETRVDIRTSKTFENSIQFIGYESDLAGLYQICDIYINPLRSGGGTTVVWAASIGLAIVTPKEASDACSHIGKVNCVETESDIAPKIKALALDEQLLNEQKNIMKELMAQRTASRFVDTIESEMLRLAEGFTVQPLRNEMGAL